MCDIFQSETWGSFGQFAARAIKNSPEPLSLRLPCGLSCLALFHRDARVQLNVIR